MTKKTKEEKGKEKEKKKKVTGEQEQEQKQEQEQEQAEQPKQEVFEESQPCGKNVFEEFGDQVGKFAVRTVESIKKSVDKALTSRNTVLTIRVNDDANDKLTMLVETGLFKSRSESAAFLIEEGIKHQEPLFKKIGKKMEEISRLKNDLRTIVSEEFGQE